MEIQRMNILNKFGMLTKKDRKELLIHKCSELTFTTCLDLTETVLISSFFKGSSFNLKSCTKSVVSIETYTQNIMEFTIWWTNFVYKDLNGFNGLSNVKFKLVDIELI